MDKFDIEDVIDGISDKLIRRHPHVFGDQTVSGSAEVLENWESIKAREKAGKMDSEAPPSMLEGIPRKLPALHEAHKISSRVARVGFEWPHIDGVFGKLEEEIEELREALAKPEAERSQEEVEDEIGDILFVLVNIARFLDVDSESALKRANRKFRHRFQYIEQELTRRGRSTSEWKLEEMETLWRQAKARDE